MKKLIILLTIIFYGTLGLAQNKKPEPVKMKTDEASLPEKTVKDSVPLEYSIYHTALLFADYEVAKSAIFSLIAKYPQHIDYVDSLARIYFSMNAYPQCVAAANFV